MCRLFVCLKLLFKVVFLKDSNCHSVVFPAATGSRWSVYGSRYTVHGRQYKPTARHSPLIIELEPRVRSARGLKLPTTERKVEQDAFP